MSVGSGPAGLTAAIYVARAGLHPLVIEGTEAGGQLMLTTEVENYPGFADGILGPHLMQQMHAQATRFEARFLAKDVTLVEKVEGIFRITVGKEVIESRTVIFATGATAKWLGVPGESRLMGYGVSGCATCDGFFFRDQEVVVVGGGDTAMEEALFLTRFAKKVILVHRGSRFRASDVMLRRVLSHPAIEVMRDSVIDEIVGEKMVEGVCIRNLNSGAITQLPTDGVFVAIGHKPNSDLLRGLVTLDADGYVVVNGTTTSLDGLFVAGDLADRHYRQAITAAGSGCQAAIDAQHWLVDYEVDPGSDPVQP